MTQPSLPPRFLRGAASIIAIATGLTRIAGLVREQINAAVFGAGTVYGAFQYAGLIPSLFLVILGGLNGPLHSAMVTVLAGRSGEQQRTVINTLTFIVGSSLAGISLGLYLLAPQCIDLLAPGLSNSSEMRSLAIMQLRIMAPVVWFGGMAGMSIGILTSEQRYGVPTISPLWSSLSVSVGVLSWQLLGGKSTLGAAQVLAIAFLAGAVLQWLTLWLAQRPRYVPSLAVSWQWHHPDTKIALGVIGSSLLFTSMVQANWYIDLAFTSVLPNPGAAVSALTFANLLAQAPLGILANMLLIPLLPCIAQSAATNTQLDLVQSVITGFRAILRWGMPISMLMAALATSIVALVYQRGAFDTPDTDLVAGVLVMYVIGMCFALARDLLIRVLYVLNAYRLLLTVSLWGLGLNLVLNVVLSKPLGVAGLVLGTGIVNLLLTAWMLIQLHQRLGRLLYPHQIVSFLKLLLGHVTIGVLIWAAQTYCLRPDSLFQLLSTLSFLTVIGCALSTLMQVSLRTGQ